MQQLMRCLAELAPYNFIHFMRVAARADIDRWRDAATQVLTEAGIGVPTFQGDRVSFRPPPPIHIETPATDIDGYLNSELNRPFATDTLPIRFFLIAHADETHSFGMVVDHWLADDYAGRQLFHRIFLRYQAPEKAADLPPVKYLDAPATNPAVALLRALPVLIRQLLDHRGAVRVSLRDPQDLEARTFQRILPAGMLEPLRQKAKQCGATIHDLFLTACAQSCAAFYAERFRGKRRRIGIVTVADARRFLAGEPVPETAIGCPLSYFTVTVESPVHPGDMAAKTKRCKATLRDGFGNLEWARIWWHRLRSSRAKATLFQRCVPTVCGVSNVNLLGSWLDGSFPELLEYRRIGPTGPITPLVFELASIGDRLTLDVTYRTAAFTRGDAELLTDSFVERLQALAQ